MKVWIPDVSEHQGKISWERLAGKIPAAIIRIGYGDDLKSQDDLYAIYNMKECKRLGIPFAVYIYGYAKNMKQLQSEIAHTKRVCKGFKPVAFWYDAEERSNENFWRAATDAWHEAFGEDSGAYSWEWAFEKHIKAGRRWICAYGKNTGKPDVGYKPTMQCDGWQFTSKGRLDGISGYVDLSEWYTDFAGVKPIEIKPTRRVVTKKEVAALIMKHLCIHDKHGYTQDMDKRQGTGAEEIDIYGRKYIIKSGDRDCSSAVISAYEAAGISCGGATYTGNMSRCMTDTGNFIRRSLKFVAQMGDCYLNDACHTAMCLSADPDVLMEFSINEKGKVTGGKTGDQKQKGEYDEAYGRGESHLAKYYNYPWSCILQCVNEEIAFIVEQDGSITEPDGDDGYSGGTKGSKAGKGITEKTAELAARVILGEYGNSTERRQKLGGKYDEVQNVVTDTLVNHREGLVKAMAQYIKGL